MSEYRFELSDTVTISTTPGANGCSDEKVLHFDRPGSCFSLILGENVYVSDLLAKVATAWARTSNDVKAPLRG